MRPTEALARHGHRIREILSHYPISNFRVFGSTARGEDTEQSDLDLLVQYDEPISLFDIARMEIDLEEALGCRVQVSTSNRMSERFRNQIHDDVRPLEGAN